MFEFRGAANADRAVLTALWQEAFGDPPGFIELFFASAFAPERSRVAVEHGTILGALYWFDCSLDGEKFAYVYAVATFVSARGRGVSTALLEDVHSLLASKGYSGVILCPGEASLFRFYADRGYTAAGSVSEAECCAGFPHPVYEIGLEGYATERARLLPPGGVAQEGENLAYLSRFARFVAGGDFVAAISREGNQILEYLGPEEGIPGLLGALGLPEARVRRPGNGRPLVMLRMLRGQRLPQPLYFGLPFD